MLKDLLYLFFPNTCPACENELLAQEKEVCFSCLFKIEETDFHLQPTDNELFLRFAGKVKLEGASGLFYFDKHGTFQKLMSALKYKNLPQVGTFLGAYYGNKLKGDLFTEQLTAIVPVPLHPSKKRKRGYNQAAEIANGLSGALSIPVKEECLVRGIKTETQTRKGKLERWENVSNGFEMKMPLSGHLLLVDDVITTGSTLESCIRVLLAQENPPQSIRVLSLGVARKD